MTIDLEASRPDAQTATSNDQTVDSASAVNDASRGTASRAGRAMRSRWTTMALGVAVAGTVTANLVVWHAKHRTSETGALAVARQEALNFFTLDYRHVHQDTSDVLALATGSFSDTYAAQRATIETGVTSKKLAVSAAVPEDAVAVEYLHGDTAQVLVAVDTTTTLPTGASDAARYRTRLVLQKAHGTWRVSQFNQVG